MEKLSLFQNRFRYNYSRDDEEIYKEFLDIANELIPQIMKTESSGHSAKSILRDPQCFANLLRLVIHLSDCRKPKPYFPFTYIKLATQKMCFNEKSAIWYVVN